MGDSPSPPPLIIPLKAVKHLEQPPQHRQKALSRPLTAWQAPSCQAGYTSFHHLDRLIEKSLMSECIFIRITYHHHPDDCAAECSHMGGNAPTVVEEVSI